MVQGALKKTQVAKAMTKHQHKPEKRKAGKNGVAKNSAIQKKLKGQSTAEIEKLMASRAGATGKLTILKSLSDPKRPGVSKKSSKK